MGRDRRRLLNRFAGQLFAGTLEAAWARKGLDRGRTRLRFFVGEAVWPGEVGAYLLDEHVPVLPLPWSLHRTPSR